MLMGLKCYDSVVFILLFVIVVVRVEVMFSCGFIYPKLIQNMYWGLNSICSILSFTKIVF